MIFADKLITLRKKAGWSHSSGLNERNTIDLFPFLIIYRAFHPPALTSSKKLCQN